MPALKKLLSACCGLLAAVALFAIMALTLVDVSGRKFLSESVPGSLELTELLMVVLICAGMQVAIALLLLSLVGVWMIKGNLDTALSLLAQASIDSISQSAIGRALPITGTHSRFHGGPIHRPAGVSRPAACADSRRPASASL